MRKLISLISIFSSLACTAQNYRCAMPEKKQYFTNNIGYLKGIRIDSVKVLGLDTVLYPFHTARQLDYQNSADVDTTGGSWLGKTITIQPDGTHLFSNFEGNTIEIRTQALPNQQWTMYSDASDTLYIASVTRLDTMSFLNVTDTVKEITITAHNSGGMIPSDPMHNKKIIVSKHHGFVQACDLYMFPMHLRGEVYSNGFEYVYDVSTRYNTDPIFSITTPINPMKSEIFDFNIGDMFEGYKDQSPTFFNVLKTVADKKNISGGIEYTINTWTRGPGTSAPPTQQSTVGSIDKLFIPDELLMDTTLMPEEWRNPYFYQYDASDTSLCTTGAFIISNNMACRTALQMAYEVETTRYKYGLGITNQIKYEHSGPFGETYTSLLCWKKGNVICNGYPTLNITETYAPEIHIYPNPATDAVTIRIPDKEFTATLYDMQGRILGTKAYPPGQHQFQLNDYATGHYLLMIHCDGVFTHHKLAIEKP